MTCFERGDVSDNRPEYQSGRSEGAIVVGVLSDTHGHLYPRVKEILEGVDHIIHAGDIGSAEVLAGLRAIAPVTAVRGNCDWEAWARLLPAQTEIELGGARILVGHMVSRLRDRLGARHVEGTAEASSPETSEVPRVVVSGHSHRIETKVLDGILYVNPGSAGPRRFGLPRTLARLFVMPPAVGERGAVGLARAEIRVESLVVDERE